MKKITCSLIISSILIYLVVGSSIDLDFIIKCSIIFMSLIIHKQGHKLLKYLVKKIKYEIVREVLIGCGGLLANLVVFLVFREIKFSYSGYIVVINLSLVIANLLPIYPADSYNVFKRLLKILLEDDVVLKITNITSCFMTSCIFSLGILQMVFFSYNCSVIVMCLFLSKYKKMNFNEEVV